MLVVAGLIQFANYPFLAEITQSVQMVLYGSVALLLAYPRLPSTLALSPAFCVLQSGQLADPSGADIITNLPAVDAVGAGVIQTATFSPFPGHGSSPSVV